MEIKDIQLFLNYYTKIKNRTRRLFEYIPKDKIEWTYHSEKFTFGDIIRHLANIERMMYAENVQQKMSLYNGCGINYAKGYENVIKFYNGQRTEGSFPSVCYGYRIGLLNYIKCELAVENRIIIFPNKSRGKGDFCFLLECSTRG